MKRKPGSEPLPISHVRRETYDAFPLGVSRLQVLGMVYLHIVIDAILFVAKPRHVHHFQRGHADMLIDPMEKLISLTAGQAHAHHDLLNATISLFGDALHDARPQKTANGKDTVIGHGAEQTADAF